MVNTLQTTFFFVNMSPIVVVLFHSFESILQVHKTYTLFSLLLVVVENGLSLKLIFFNGGRERVEFKKKKCSGFVRKVMFLCK